MKVAIIGLGLIGGSIARRLRGFHNCTISAYNRTSETVLLAKQDGAIDEGSSDVGEVMDNADLIILCLYPQLNVDMVKNNLSHIKPGAVITDVSYAHLFLIYGESIPYRRACCSTGHRRQTACYIHNPETVCKNHNSA